MTWYSLGSGSNLIQVIPLIVHEGLLAVKNVNYWSPPPPPSTNPTGSSRTYRYGYRIDRFDVPLSWGARVGRPKDEVGSWWLSQRAGSGSSICCCWQTLIDWLMVNYISCRLLTYLLTYLHCQYSFVVNTQAHDYLRYPAVRVGKYCTVSTFPSGWPGNCVLCSHCGST